MSKNTHLPSRVYPGELDSLRQILVLSRSVNQLLVSESARLQSLRRVEGFSQHCEGDYQSILKEISGVCASTRQDAINAQEARA